MHLVLNKIGNIFDSSRECRSLDNSLYFPTIIYGLDWSEYYYIGLEGFRIGAG